MTTSPGRNLGSECRAMHELADSFFSALDSFLTPPTANFHRCSTRVFASKEERREREREAVFAKEGR